MPRDDAAPGPGLGRQGVNRDDHRADVTERVKGAGPRGRDHRPGTGGLLALALVVAVVVWPRSGLWAAPESEDAADRLVIREIALEAGPADSGAGPVTGRASSVGDGAEAPAGAPLEDSARVLIAALGEDPLGTFLVDIYRDRAFLPLWVSGDSPNERGRVLMDTLALAGAEGLDEGPFNVEALRKILAEESTAGPMAAEAWLSRAFVRFAFDRLLGQSRRDRPFAERVALLSSEERTTPRALLLGAAAAPDMAAYLAGLEPPTPQYRGLVLGLAHYRALEASGGWVTEFPPGDSLRLGDRDPRVPLLRRRLAAEGFLTAPKSDTLEASAPGPTAATPAVDHQAADASAPQAEADPESPAEQAVDPLVYDAALVEAVTRFQASANLVTDGVAGRNTFAALGRGAGDRVDQIRVALERWRLLPRQLGSTHVLVNVPAYELFLNENLRPVLRMPVAVGRKIFQTPLFSDEIEYMEFNPFWNVPRSIAENEVIPKQVEDPEYLARRGFTVIPRHTAPVASEGEETPVDWSQTQSAAATYRLRQAPGPANPLGTVKFMFPNRHSVYLHDTNAPRVFSRSYRAVSHGCVRVQDPEGLANYLLARYTDQPDRSAQSYRGSRPRVVRLNRTVPVHLVYITAWAETDGRIRFSGDVYDRDNRLLRSLRTTAETGETDAAVAAR